MAEICILMVPSLRSSMEKAASLIIEFDYDVVFLNFPYNLQSIVSRYTAGQMTLNHFLAIIRTQHLIPEPVNSWLYLNQPLLERLPTLGKKFSNVNASASHYLLRSVCFDGQCYQKRGFIRLRC